MRATPLPKKGRGQRMHSYSTSRGPFVSCKRIYDRVCVCVRKQIGTNTIAESIAPPAKKAKRNAPLSRLTAQERAKQFSSDFYADGGVLFSRFCDHSVDFMRLDTVKDHLKSKKHTTRKEARKANPKSSGSDGPFTSMQTTLGTVVKSRELREVYLRLSEDVHHCGHTAR